MPDREKVLKGLECCLVSEEYYQCEKCPYRATEDERKVIDWCCHLGELRKDALELLKEQEPRVLTLGEVKAFDYDYCYLEEERMPGKEYRGVCGRYKVTCITWPSITQMRIARKDDTYGKSWRCWTAKPTDEQRKAVKWDD